MKWLMMLVAVVLGAGITWLITVRRVTRQIMPTSALGDDSAGDEAARDATKSGEAALDAAKSDEGARDEAAGYGGAATQESSSLMGWDRTSQDEDALFPHDVQAGQREVTDVPPIAGATPNGDLAGVSAPRADAGPQLMPVDEGPTTEALGPEVAAQEVAETQPAAGPPKTGELDAREPHAAAPEDDDPPVPGTGVDR